MEVIRNFMVYQPRYVNKHVENYLNIIGNIKLISSGPIDYFPENVPSVRNQWNIALGEYKKKYEYVFEISSKQYPFTIYIRETHMKDKYAPVDSTGYFVVSFLLIIKKDTSTRNGMIQTYINHMLDSLDDKIKTQLREINNKQPY